MIEPAIMLAETVWLPGDWRTMRLVCTGLVPMVGVSVQDLIPPANHRYGPDGCEFPAKHD